MRNRILYKSNVLGAVSILLPSFAPFYNLSFAEPNSVKLSDPVLKDANGNVLSSLNPGQQTSIFVTIGNNEAFSQPFAVIIELRDIDGITSNLQWKAGTLEPNEVQEIEVPWVVNFDKPMEISARAFVISGFENPTILSSVKKSSFGVVSLQQKSGDLDVFLQLEDWVEPGDYQTITVQVYDEETGSAIEDAYVDVHVSGNTFESFVGYTDYDGEAIFSWTIDSDSEPGLFDVIIDVSATGYDSESFFPSFEVIDT